MGDMLDTQAWPEDLDASLIEQALDVGFGPPEAKTLGLVVTHKGQIIGERYSHEVDIHTPLEELVHD